MSVITQNYDIDLKATGEFPVVKMSQFDTGSRTIVFTVYDGHDLANIDGMVARVDGTRSDGVEFSSTCTVGTGSKVSFEINQEMTKHAGKHAAELVIFDASGNPIGTQNFIIDVEAAPMVRDSAASADDRTLYDQYTDSVEAKFNSLSASLTAKADALNKTVQDIDALLGGSSKQATIFDVSVDASTTGTGITGTALAHAQYDPITGLVTFVAKTVDGLSGVKGSQQFQLGAIDSKYLPDESLFKSDGWSDGSKVFLLGYDRIDDTGYGAEAYIAKDGKVYASFVYPATATGDENAYRPVFYAQWYARGGKFIGVTPMTGGNTLTIGKTMTGEPGTQASVVNSGTAKDVVLDFTIPRGADGTGGGSSYTLPVATSSTLGGVKIGSGITVTDDGTISSGNVYRYGSESEKSIAVEPNCDVTDDEDTEGSVFIGGAHDSSAGSESVVIGVGASCGSYATAVGKSAFATADAVSIGMSANADGVEGIAVGKNARIGNFARYGIAIGADSSTKATNSVAIGYGSSATEGNTVSVGNDTTTRRIVNVTDPTSAQDAATKSYVDSKVTSGGYTLPAATTSTLGGVKVGDNLTVTEDGTLAATAYTLPAATESTLGGVKVGTGLTVTSDGTINAQVFGLFDSRFDKIAIGRSATGVMCLGVDKQSFAPKDPIGDRMQFVLSLKPATASTVGGVKIGAGINVAADGTIDVQALLDRIAALESKVAALESK